MAFENRQSLNVYMPWAVMRRDLEPNKKGSEADVIAVLAAVADLDHDKYQIGEFPISFANSGQLIEGPCQFVVASGRVIVAKSFPRTSWPSSPNWPSGLIAAGARREKKCQDILERSAGRIESSESNRASNCRNEKAKQGFGATKSQLRYRFIRFVDQWKEEPSHRNSINQA